MDNYLGEIRMFCGNYEPYGWAFCWGQTLSVNQNAALFALLGITYGGNGQTTFCLPDLRGSVPVHCGRGTGLTLRVLGENFGSPSTTLTVSNLPTHTHAVAANTAAGNSSIPTNNIFANRGKGDADFVSTAPNAFMDPTVIGATGSGIPVSNIQPSMVVNFIIALQGIYPTRP